MNRLQRCFLLRARRAALLALAGLLCASAARADNLDTWNIFIGTNVTYYSNLFLLPPSANAQLLIGTSDKSDILTATTFGLKINKAYSLQRFELDLNIIDYRYRNFDYLNFTAPNYNAAWRWRLTPYLSGNLSSSFQESMNNFYDTRNFRRQNLRTYENQRFDADLELGAGWHLLGGVTQDVSKNSEIFVAEGDTTINSVEAGARYAFPSGSSLKYINRTGRGVYDNRPVPIPAIQLDNQFDQTTNELSLKWPISDKTSLNGRIGWLDRSHDTFTSRDFSGTIGELSLNWNVTDKTLIRGGWTRQLAAYETEYSSYTVTDGFYFNPIWQTSAKTALRFRYDYMTIDYLGAIAPTAFNGRSDKLNTALLAFDWQPLNALSLSATVTDSRRTSNTPDNDYKNATAGINVQFNF
ncbi:MAG: putative exosortase B-associated extracellular polysaccharide biosynthesis transporter EpsL [Propionivibrio sp.]|uniref:XrtB/PEP-CTERM-associated polysaccharide biosynthesis outer membrane protein EpsL n=1 Tax=Propionivibrio sp. TaxID=2212460 RepID=UPI001A512D82|nr:XrtB/PEP-CTERM-associated polysaccharide biosynthesis outer membrane protein EpsL [Propionivibrio sp.]MBL8414028.1 putative exosortase B-associated extracellular polysaccharide biosynthesis transporter EpsL [Propionivibrio sp.]